MRTLVAMATYSFNRLIMGKVEIGKGGGVPLYMKFTYVGFCPRIDFHNIMHIDCLTYDTSICDIVFLLPIYMVKKSDVLIGYQIIGVPSVYAAHNSHSIIYLVLFVVKTI